MDKQLTYSVRAGRVGGDGYRAAILFPTRHGELILSATVPAGAAQAFGAQLRDLMRRQLVGGEHDGMADVARAARDCRVEGLEALLPAAQAGLSMLPIPGPAAGIISQALPALAGLLGGASSAPPPRFDPNRPANLPPPGSPANLERIARFVGVADGMDAAQARSKLAEGAAQRWNQGDHDDALLLLGALPASGPVQLSQLVAAAAAPSPPAAMPRTAAQAALPAAPATAAAMASLAAGALPARAAAPALAVPGVLAQAAQLTAQAPGLFGPRALDFHALSRSIMDAADAVVGAEVLSMPGARAQLEAMRACEDPRVAEALRAAGGFHNWLHGA